MFRVGCKPLSTKNTCYGFIYLLIVAPGFNFEACGFYTFWFKSWALVAYTHATNFVMSSMVCHLIWFLEFGDWYHSRLQFCMWHEFCLILTNILCQCLGMWLLLQLTRSFKPRFNSPKNHIWFLILDNNVYTIFDMLSMVIVQILEVQFHIQELLVKLTPRQ